MDELDRTHQERLFISAYWPQRAKDELHVGYGVAKGYLVYQSVGIVVTVTSRIFGMFFEPKIRSLRALLRVGPMLVISLIMPILAIRRRKQDGFYQLDEHGMPTFFIGKFPPESIQGRVGVSRKKFLKYLSDGK